ncbi:MAG: hypothetical protein KTR30_12395 [Saprospiraceae bacterium]|nr:hypothetical protein [Saprospiraceae bacterium]
MKTSNFKITGYSTALFATWFFIEDLGLLLDAGDGVSAGLLQKSRKVKQVFISHADRDHLTGLLQFNQLNARPGLPVIHYPADSGSFPALAEFGGKFDQHVQLAIWEPLRPGDEVFLKKDIIVQAIRNGHVQAPTDKSKSLSFKVVRLKQKIKPEFADLEGSEIARLAKDLGRNFISVQSKETLLGYSGDSPVEDYDRWDNTPILIHEATFLDGSTPMKEKANKHSRLDEVMQMVASINVGTLILSHFSSRYSPAEIDAAILRECKAHKIDIPVYRVLPGQTHRDILAKDPVNA